MVFSDLSIWDTAMQPITPDWLLTTTKPCGGEIKKDSHTGDLSVEYK
jgi:hypothetical protein